MTIRSIAALGLACLLASCNSDEPQELCGNGVIDPGETCDGFCPDCDDGDPCTQDSMSGSAATCDVVCSWEAIPDCGGPECGNGEVEEGETCDGDCPSDCDDGDECTTDTLNGDPSDCDVTCTHEAVPDCIEPGAYYVDQAHPDCSDSNPGTEDRPWCTITQAATTLTAGETVVVKTGTYQGRVVPQASGAEDAWITYRSYPGDEVTVEAVGEDNGAFIVYNTHYIRIQGFVLTGGQHGGIYIVGPASHLEFEHLEIVGNQNGLEFWAWETSDQPMSHIRITDCLIDHNYIDGIKFWGPVSDVLIDSNHISYNGTASPPILVGDNIAIAGKTRKIDNPDGTETTEFLEPAVRFEVTNNDVHHAVRQGISTWNVHDILVQNNHCHHNGATGIQIENASRNVVVDGNLCEHNVQVFISETGIWIDDAENVIVQNNTCRHNQTGIEVSNSNMHFELSTNRTIVRNNLMVENNTIETPYFGHEGWPTARGFAILAAYDSYVSHNSMYGNGHADSVTSGGVTVQDWRDSTARGAVLKNNIVSESLSQHDLWVISQQSDQATVYQSDFNNYHNSRSLSARWLDANVDWDHYLTLSGDDLNSIIDDPLFEDPASHNFELQTGSPSIEAGDFLTRTVAAGSGTQVEVEDAGWFSDGFGVVDGDAIQIGDRSPVVVVSVDYATNLITVDSSVSWEAGDGVSYPFSGTRPDMGRLFDP